MNAPRLTAFPSRRPGTTVAAMSLQIFGLLSQDVRRSNAADHWTAIAARSAWRYWFFSRYPIASESGGASFSVRRMSTKYLRAAMPCGLFMTGRLLASSHVPPKPRKNVANSMPPLTPGTPVRRTVPYRSTFPDASTFCSFRSAARYSSQVCGTSTPAAFRRLGRYHR